MIRLLFFLLAASSLALAGDPSPVLTLPAMPEPEFGADSLPRDGVPKGILTTHLWKDSKVFPGTIREYHVYTPAGYDASKPCAVMPRPRPMAARASRAWSCWWPCTVRRKTA